MYLSLYLFTLDIMQRQARAEYRSLEGWEDMNYVWKLQRYEHALRKNVSDWANVLEPCHFHWGGTFVYKCHKCHACNFKEL